MTNLEIKKALTHTKFVCTEYPALMWHFLPFGVLNIKSNNPSSYRYEWSIIHKGEEVVIKVSPHLIDGHGEFKVLMMKNHITLISLKDPDSILHLNRLQIKSY